MNLVCLDLINTEWALTHPPDTELLNDPKWVRDFLAKWGLPAHFAITVDQSSELIELRSLLSQAATAINQHGRPTAEQIEQINRRLAATPLQSQLQEHDDSFRLSVSPVSNDWSAVLYQITASFADLLAVRDIKRLKRCDNPDCQWIFYDESKNSTRRWCCNTCASLIKVRRFRSKQKA